MKKILLLVANSEMREQLSKILAAEHEILVQSTKAALPQQFDLCIADQSTFIRYAEQIRTIKQQTQPAFLPVLLWTSAEELTNLEPGFK